MARGKTLIMVAGIILTIFGGLAVLGFALAALAGGVIAGVGVTAAANGGGNAGLLAGAAGGVFMIAALIGGVVAAMQLVFGILGIKYSGRPEKAGTIFGIGVFLVVLQLISTASAAYNLVSGAANSSALGIGISTVLGLILPLLYIVGARMNKQG